MGRPKGSKNKIIVSSVNIDNVIRGMRKSIRDELYRDELYRVTLALKNGEMYESSGATLLEAMSKIKVEDLIKTLGTIYATYKDKKVTRVCNAPRLQRIFGTGSKANEIARVTYAKFLNTGLL